MTASESTAITRIVENQLRLISDSVAQQAIEGLLVPPQCAQREWDYGDDGQTYPCWTVLEHPRSNTCIVYCEHGFGPGDPWGLLFMSGEHMSMGMDAQWYASLEDAFRESAAWDSENPLGYEIQ